MNGADATTAVRGEVEESQASGGVKTTSTVGGGIFGSGAALELSVSGSTGKERRGRCSVRSDSLLIVLVFFFCGGNRI